MKGTGVSAPSNLTNDGIELTRHQLGATSPIMGELSNCRILHVRRRYCAAPPLPYKYAGTARTKRPDSELIKDLLLRRRIGGKLKMWATTIKADLEPLSGPQVFGYALGASICDVVNSIGDVGSTHPG